MVTEKIETMTLVAKTGRTIVDKEVLLESLKEAKANHFTMSEEEYLPGLIAIGAPLFDPISGKGVGAVSFDFSVLEHSADDIRKKYGNMIQETARSLSDLMPLDKNRRH
jgi:DNA-binding IclR family transcriptional regulator